MNLLRIYVSGPRQSGKTTYLKKIAMDAIANNAKVLYFTNRADNAEKFLPEFKDKIVRTNSDAWVGRDFNVVLIDCHEYSPWIQEILNTYRGIAIFYTTQNTP